MEVDKLMWGLTNLNSLQAEDKEAITNFWNQRNIDLQAFGNYLDAEKTANKDRPFKEIIAAASTAWNKDALDKKKLSAPKSVKRRAYQFSEMTNKLVAFKDEAGLTKEDKEYLRPLVVTTTKSLKTDDFEECDGRTADQIYLDFVKLNHFDNYEHWNLSAEKRTETLNKQFDEYIEMYKEESKISGFVPLGGASNEVVTIAGRIVNTDPDAEFKSSVELINLSAENEHGRTKVKLNLDDVVDPVLLFEGQIVMAKGTWDQENFYVQSIDTLPIVKAKYENTQMENGMLSVYVFAGPYSFPDSLNYTMLKQVVSIIKEHKPHFVILAGPFVDINNDYVKEGEFMFYNDRGEVDWFEDLDIYGSIKNYIDSAIKSTNTKVVSQFKLVHLNYLMSFALIQFSDWFHL